MKCEETIRKFFANFRTDHVCTEYHKPSGRLKGTVPSKTEKFSK